MVCMKCSKKLHYMYGNGENNEVLTSEPVSLHLLGTVGFLNDASNKLLPLWLPI